MSAAARARGTCLVLLLLVALAPPAGATWSIVLVDTATREVAVGGATCLTGVDLMRLLPVVLVERGGGCAQAQVDFAGVSKKKMWDQLLLGTPPADIIPILLTNDPASAARQYGIADLSPAGAGYTGTSAFQYKNDLHGSAGTLTYAIQGNILTGAPVLEMARDAILASSGTLADRLMAGMEAARLMGGDGRCSCVPSMPTSCGSPPPSFEKSAHVGFVVVARPGDTDGACTGSFGCATGDYWLELNVKNQLPTSLDPVLQLQGQYADFHASLQGHPDGLRSLALLDDPQVLADGHSSRELTVALFDVDGVPLTHGGAAFTLTHAAGSAGLSHLGAVADHGDGTYTLQIVAGQGVGTDRLAVRVDDGFKPATLFPYPELVQREALQASADSLPAAGGTLLGLDLLGPSGPDGAAGSHFVVLFSSSGTQPGQVMFGGLQVPLNFDRLFHLSPLLPGLGMLAGSPGVLDASSRAQAVFAPRPSLLAPLVGLQVAGAWLTFRPATFASNPVLVQIVP